MSTVPSFLAELRRMWAPVRCRVLFFIPVVGAVAGVALGRVAHRNGGSAALLSVLLDRAHYELGWQLMTSVWLVGVLAAAIVGPFLGAEAFAGERDRGALPLRVMLGGYRSVVVRRALASWVMLAGSILLAFAASLVCGMILARLELIDTNIERPDGLALGLAVTIALASGSWAVSLVASLRLSLAPAVVAGTAFYVAGVIVRELMAVTSGPLPAMEEVGWIRNVMTADPVDLLALVPGVAWCAGGLVVAVVAAGALRVE